jgi:hypothetical protein
MNWHDLLACFFAGALLTNAVPHFVHGVSGDRFPTPFARPPGKGLSPPLLNMVWALLNLAAGYTLFRAGHFTAGDNRALLGFFAGIAVLGIGSSLHFAGKYRN